MAQALPVAAAAEGGGGYVQRGVPAEATAENAVIARTRALASAQRIAYERMAQELGLPKGLSDSQIDGMISSIIVEEERTTRTGYTGRLTVNFNPNRVPGAGRAVAGASGGAAGGGFSAPPSDAAPPIMPGASLPATAFAEATAYYMGLTEWLELRRRLLASPEIASVDINAIAVDGARLRLGLRRDPAAAAAALAASGIAVALPAAAGAQPAASPGRLPPPVPLGAAAAAQPLPGSTASATGPWQIGLVGRI